MTARVEVSIEDIMDTDDLLRGVLLLSGLLLRDALIAQKEGKCRVTDTGEHFAPIS